MNTPPTPARNGAGFASILHFGIGTIAPVGGFVAPMAGTVLIFDDFALAGVFCSRAARLAARWASSLVAKDSEKTSPTL